MQKYVVVVIYGDKRQAIVICKNSKDQSAWFKEICDACDNEQEYIFKDNKMVNLINVQGIKTGVVKYDI